MKTTKQAAKLLGYASDAVIRKMIERGKIKAVKFGHIWMISDKEIEELKRLFDL